VVAIGVGLGASRWRLSRLAFVALAGAGASALLLAAIYNPGIDPSRVYYGTDTRATGLLVGAALAFMWRPGGRRPLLTSARGTRPSGRFRRRWGWTRPALLDAVGLVALAGLGAFCLRLDEFQPFLYTGGFGAVSLTTAALIAVVAHPQSRVGRLLLGWRPLRWVGERSYGIYLWHWPVFMITRPGLDVPLDGAGLLGVRLALTLGLAHLSYRYVEQPVRHGAIGRSWRRLREADRPGRREILRRLAAVGVPALAVCAALGVAVARAEPPEPPAFLATREIHSATRPAQEPPEDSPPAASRVSPGPEGAASEKGSEKLDPDEETEADARAGTSGGELSGHGGKARDDGATIPSGPVSAIGDSVMLGSAGPFRREVEPSVMDAEVGMQVSRATEVLRSRRAAGQLGEVVVVHLGNNGAFTRAHFEALMRVLDDVERVVFVNVRVPRAWEASNNEVITSGVERHPNAELVDWYSASAGRPELFVSDGVHLQPPGQRLYAAMISERIGEG
jgi:hypothetical protein